MIRKIYLLVLMVWASSCNSDVPENQGQVQSILFVGEGENQPLIVGLGGSEGGNAWASDRWKKTRDKFINEGYAFLAVAYFGAEGTPEQLDRISIEAVHQAILEKANDHKVDRRRIAVIGGSKGAELALLMASKFNDINCLVAMVPSHCAFPALTLGASTSSWTYRGEEVPFVPMSWSAVPSAMKKDFRTAFTIMLEDKEAVEKARIKVEEINGPVLLISAKKDEMWPSTEMANEVVVRLRDRKFPHVYEHIAVNGGHTDVLDHFDSVLAFVNKNFRDK